VLFHGTSLLQTNFFFAKVLIYESSGE